MSIVSNFGLSQLCRVTYILSLRGAEVGFIRYCNYSYTVLFIQAKLKTQGQ